MNAFLLAAALLAQSGKQPFSMKEGLSTARKAATSWDSGAYFAGASFTPATEAIFKSGKRMAWEFLFATRSKCPAGKVRTVTVTVSGDEREIRAAKKVVDGFAVTIGGESDRDPPLPAPVDEDFMDADRVLRACEKLGATKMNDHGQLDVAMLGGGTVWVARILNERVLMNAKNGTVIYRGKDDGAKEALAHFAKKTSWKEAAELVRKELAKWGKDQAGEPLFTGIEGRTLSAEAFAKGGECEASGWEMILPKPEPRWVRLEVINNRVTWQTPRITPQDDAGRFKDPVALRAPEWEKFKPALAANAKAKAWIEAGKGTLAWKVIDAKQMTMTLVPEDPKREELTLRYLFETDVVE